MTDIYSQYIKPKTKNRIDIYVTAFRVVLINQYYGLIGVLVHQPLVSEAGGIFRHWFLFEILTSSQETIGC